MRRTSPRLLLLATLLCLAAARSAEAQYAYGYSQISYDDNNNVVYGYSATELDYDASVYYDAYVEGYLYDEFSLRSSGSEAGYYGLADVWTQTAAAPSTMYTLYSDHYVIAYFYSTFEDCFYCCSCWADNTCCTYYSRWSDYWGYNFFSNGGYYNDWWDFFGPGPEIYLDYSLILLGTTSLTLSTPDFCEVGGGGGGGEALTTQSTTCDVRPTIQGPRELWYFNGVQGVPNYTTNATLTAHPAGAGPYFWEIFSGGGRITATTNDNRLDIHTTGRSHSQNDVAIRVTVRGASASYRLTVRAPHTVVNTLTDYRASSINGWQTLMYFKFRDQFTVNMVYDLPMNEWLGPPQNDYPGGNNWGCCTAVGNMANSAEFRDNYTPPPLSSGPHPVPQSPNNGLSSQRVLHADQSYQAGSMTVGVGRTVQRHKLQFFITHAAQENVISPASP